MPYLNKPKKQWKPTDTYSRARRMDIYNTSLWRQMRRSQLMNHPLCQVCEGCGRTTMAIDVHHIVSFTGYEGDDRKAVAFDRNNLVSLCKGCHQAAHHGCLKGAATVEEMVKRAAINLYR